MLPGAYGPVGEVPLKQWRCEQLFTNIMIRAVRLMGWGVSKTLSEKWHWSRVLKHDDGHWTGEGSREGCFRQREEYMQKPLRMRGVWTVGETTEQPVWPESSEHRREWCRGRLVAEAGEAGDYGARARVRSSRAVGVGGSLTRTA